MNIKDIIFPHRFLINRNLRFASSELKAEIETCKKKHRSAIHRCYEEIEKEREKKNLQFEELKNECREALDRHGHILREFETLFIDYVDEVMKEEQFRLQRKKIKLELKQLCAHIRFLSEQKKLIDEDIKILRGRQDVLTAQVKVNDIILLINATGTNIPCDEADDSQALLKKVDFVISSASNLPQETSGALSKLRTLLQERSECLPLIQYVKWLIQQKINLKNELYRERREIDKTTEHLNAQYLRVNNELNEIRETTLNKAIEIRNIWAKRLVDIYLSTEESLREKLNHRKCAIIKINTMKSERSHDTARWERLWEEVKSINKDIIEIRKRRSEQSLPWIEHRKSLLDVLNKNGVFLKKTAIPDEVRVLEQYHEDLYRQINIAVIPEEKKVLQDRLDIINSRIKHIQERARTKRT